MQATFYRKPRFLTLPFRSVKAEIDALMIESYAKRYDPDSGDSIKEYCETLGVTKEEQRLIKAAIRKLRK